VSAVEVLRCTSGVQFVFKADQARGMVLFDPEYSVQFAKRFNLSEPQIVEGNPANLWQYARGVFRLSDKRKLVLGPIVGNENELGVFVEGTSEDALDLLREIWSVLSELAEEELSTLDESLGAVAYITTAVVRMPKTHRELFPGVELLARYTRQGLRDPVIGVPGVEAFRVETRCTVPVGAISVERATIIEPRFTAKADDRIFFTQSPLRSDLHITMLEDLCRSVG
jgi:hypothetical protein